ncbi:MAG TPA: glycosyltransferase family 2 protein [Longimicrobiales bacterium]|nr:glycosyltransferase family 2 protein [Longimicrobiales bacterium]
MVLTGLQMLFAVPWVVLLFTVPILLAKRVRISGFSAPSTDEAPLVSIIVPARNESVNISVCVASLLNSLYPKSEIIVVDDGSVDGTGDIVRILAEHANGRLRLVEGEPLPEGWLGKPWACWQGYRQARGDLLLFTDADTRHDDTLLGHAVGALKQRHADLVSVMPHQVMGSFWERLILPHIFTILAMRYHDLSRVNRSRRPRDVIANGQFLLVTREAYEAVGGHEALRAEVVEDQRLAQWMVAKGRRIFIAHAHDLMDTRMYRSLRGIVEGWSKNLARGSRSAAPRWISPLVPWLIVVYLAAMWIAPPATLLASLVTPLNGTLFGWSLAATVLGLAFWLPIHLWNRVPIQYALAYPFGATAAAVLFIRSAVRGDRVEWKGRSYS